MLISATIPADQLISVQAHTSWQLMADTLLHIQLSNLTYSMLLKLLLQLLRICNPLCNPLQQTFWHNRCVIYSPWSALSAFGFPWKHMEGEGANRDLSILGITILGGRTTCKKNVSELLFIKVAIATVWDSQLRSPEKLGSFYIDFFLQPEESPPADH